MTDSDMKAHYGELLSKTFQALTRDDSITDTAKLYATLTVQMHLDSPKGKLKSKQQEAERRDALFKKFLADNIIEDAGANIPLKMVKDRYKEWNKYQPSSTMTAPEFFKVFTSWCGFNLITSPCSRLTGYRLLEYTNP